MAYEIYKILHLVGIFMLATGLTATLVLVWNGQQLSGRAKTFAFTTHGLGLVFILVSGFGLLARLGIVRDMPAWVFVKLAIWLVFGAMISLLKRKGALGWPLYFLMLGIFICAAYFGVYKPNFG